MFPLLTGCLYCSFTDVKSFTGEDAICFCSPLRLSILVEWMRLLETLVILSVFLMRPWFPPHGVVKNKWDNMRKALSRCRRLWEMKAVTKQERPPEPHPRPPPSTFTLGFALCHEGTHRHVCRHSTQWSASNFTPNQELVLRKCLVHSKCYISGVERGGHSWASKTWLQSDWIDQYT